MDLSTLMKYWLWYCIRLPKVCLCTGDLLAIKGIRAHEHKKSISKLLTNGGDVGDAHKGWQLVCVKHTKTKTVDMAMKEAMDTIGDIIKTSKNEQSKETFVFSRRTLGQWSICVFWFPITCSQM